MQVLINFQILLDNVEIFLQASVPETDIQFFPKSL